MWFILEKLLGWLLPGLFKQVGESITKGIDDARDDRAHEDAGAATERAQNAEIGRDVSQAMAEAQTQSDAPDAAETALEGGTFLMSVAMQAQKRVVRRKKPAKPQKTARRRRK